MSGTGLVPDEATGDQPPADQPPPRVVGDARSAFHDAIVDATPVSPVYDSWNDRGTLRVLLFRGRGCALALMCRAIPGGHRVTGAVVGISTSVSVVVRRPGRPFLRLATSSDGRVGPATVPRGLISVVTEYCDRGVPTRWQSDWLKL
jgi:hypothetical protein